MYLKSNSIDATESAKANSILQALNLLKVLAIALVFNSHCGKLYPSSVFATGGALGNSLFFIISGYLLKLERTTSFKQFIKKRFFQLYPGMWLVSIINLMIFKNFPNSFSSFVYRFIWPTGFWFVGGLILFNALIFLLNKMRVFEKFMTYSICIWVLYFVWYGLFLNKTAWHVEDHGLFRMVYYFFIYTLGYCVKIDKIKICISGLNALIIASVGFLGNIGWKLILVKIPSLMWTQFMCQLFCVIWAFAILIWGLQIESKYRSVVSRKIKTPIDFWSRYSLEIYFSQRLAQRAVVSAAIGFPINMIIAILITLIYAIPIKIFTSYLIRRNSI